VAELNLTPRAAICRYCREPVVERAGLLQCLDRETLAVVWSMHPDCCIEHELQFERWPDAAPLPRACVVQRRR
jgi:hypothetical protein